MPGDKKKTKKANNKVEQKATKLAGAATPNAAELIAAARAAAFTGEAPEQAFAHFRSLAEEVPAEGLPPFTGQALLMRANLKAALKIMEPHLEAAVPKLREPRLAEVLELPSMAMALDFAAGRVPVAKLSAGDIDRMLSEGAPWRELMLAYLEVASHPLLGLLPRERVTAVRAGTGKLSCLAERQWYARPCVVLDWLSRTCGPSLSSLFPYRHGRLRSAAA